MVFPYVFYIAIKYFLEYSCIARCYPVNVDTYKVKVNEHGPVIVVDFEFLILTWFTECDSCASK